MLSPTVPTQPRKFSKTVSKSLPVKLIPAEIREKSDAIVSKLQELQQLEVELKNEMAERKAAIKDLKGTIGRELACIKSGIEVKRVECEQHYDLDAQQTFFAFRGEEYDRTKLSDFEMKAFTRPPLFPDHKDEVDPAKAAAKDDDEVDDREPGNVEPLRKDETPESQVADVIRQETSGRGRNRKDHTA